MLNLPESQRLHGLVTATHTPFHEDGSLNLDVVEKQAAFLLSKGVKQVFIGGSTGESHSLTFEERHLLAKCWMAVVKGTPNQRSISAKNWSTLVVGIMRPP